MKNLSLADTLAIIEEGSLVLLYLSMPNCSVCHAVQPRIKQMFEDTDLPMLALDAFEVPEVAGTFQVMTAPAILVFYQGKEVHRQARFIDFDLLQTIIQNYQAITEPTNYTDLFTN